MSASDILSRLKPRMEHWCSILELFILSDVDPRMNRNSQQGSFVREAFGVLLPNRSKYLEKLISRKKKRWSLLGKFIVPTIKREVPTYEDITPITVLNREASVKTNLTWGEFFKPKIDTDLERDLGYDLGYDMVPRDEASIREETLLREEETSLREEGQEIPGRGVDQEISRREVRESSTNLELYLEQVVTKKDQARPRARASRGRCGDQMDLKFHIPDRRSPL